MSTRRIALIGYPAEYFLTFAKALEQVGFEVYWVCALKADAKHLLRNGVLASRVLEVNHNFKLGIHSLAECRDELARFENNIDPKVNDIILMDRLISKKDWHFSVEYLHHVAKSITSFLSSNGINLVSSWRDTAIQLMAMLVARRLGIPFVIPTRIRIPQEVYGFCTAHHTESFISLRETSADDISWAEDFLSAFESRGLRPALKKSTRNFIDILRFMPSHLRAFLYELRRSFSDVGNDYTRYPIGRLAAMYLKRRVNLVRFKLLNPSERHLPLDKRFCIYALHTQPESSIDVQGSYFADQLELIRHIARSLPSTHMLYVKVHPTDVDGKSLDFYRRIKGVPSVVLVGESVDSRSLIDRASIVFALTGTIAYEAGLMQKPVIAFARNYFNALPTVHRCDTPTALPALISRLLSDDRPVSDGRAQIISFLANIRASCFDGELSRTYGASNEQLRPSDLRQLQVAYDTVHRFLTADRHP
jgi:hypothetical protein